MKQIAILLMACVIAGCGDSQWSCYCYPDGRVSAQTIHVPWFKSEVTIMECRDVCGVQP